MRVTNWAWALPCALLLCACGEQTEASGTRGENGRVTFNYRRSCFFGCSLQQPLLSGTRERIAVDGVGDDEDVRATSSDEQLAQFAIERSCHCQREDDDNDRFEIALDAGCDGVYEKRCDNDVLVMALAPGEPLLELRDATGSVVDRAPLLVREADSAEFEATFRDRLGAQPGTEFELAAGQSFELGVALFDEDGRKLLAPEGVLYRVQDPNVAAVTAFLLGGGAELRAGLDVVVAGKAEGQTAIQVDVPGLQTQIAINVAR